MSKIKPSEKAVNRVAIGFSKWVVLLLALTLISASGAASVASGPAAGGAGSSSGGPSVTGAKMGMNTTMEISASGSGESDIYIVGGGQVTKLSPQNGGTLWYNQDERTGALEVNPENGEVYTADWDDGIVAYYPNGSVKWTNQSAYSIHEIGAMEYHREVKNLTLWDHHGGYRNRVYVWNTSNGEKLYKRGSGLQNTRQIVGWDGYYWGEAAHYYDDPRDFGQWEAPLRGDNSDFQKEHSEFYGHAMGSSENYLWIERNHNGSWSKFNGYDTTISHEVTLELDYDLDQVAGYENFIYGVNNGSVRKYDIQPSSGDWVQQWKTDIWSSNENMSVKVNYGNGKVLVANTYDVALLNKEGDVLWTRTFSYPVRDIGISDTEPETYNISGEVVDANNDPVENATIEVQTQFQTIAAAQTNASGYYKVTGLAPDTYEIMAWKNGFDSVTKTRDVTSDIVLDFLLQRSDESTLEGTVDDAFGNPIQGATVEVTLNGQTVGSAQTDNVGFYKITGIPNGTYEVKASKTGYQSSSLTLTINSFTTQDFILVKGENVVRGYVRDTDGLAIKDVIVSFGQNGTAVASTTTDGNGYYEILIDDGNYTAIFSKNGYEEVQINKSIFSDQWFNVTMGDLSLIIEAPRYMKHGTEATYKVWVSNGSDRWEVTGHTNLTLSSSNYTVVGIDRANQKLEATPDTSINKLVIIRANYEYTNQTELYDDHEVTVANSTVSQLPILPPWWAFNAIMSDDTIFALIIMIWTAVVASRWTTAFGGLGAGSIAGIIFWYAGYLSVGMMLLAGFMALFLGMNVATNIEYSVRQ